MRRLREHPKSLRDGPATEFLLRLRVVLITRQVDLVATRAEQR